MEELQVKKKLKPTMAEPKTSNFEVFEPFFICSSSSYSFETSETKKLFEDPVFGDVNITCKCSISFDATQVTIKLIKNCSKPVMATIKLQLDSMDSEIKIVNKWITECKFKDILLTHSHQALFKSGMYSTESRHRNRNYGRDNDFSIEVKCKIIWYGFVDEFYSPSSSKYLTSYSEDMDFSDMKIKVGDKYYPAHKMTVSFQSSVLKKTLTANMKESQENCIDLTDLGRDVVEQLLLFLYGNKILKAEKDEDLLLKLLKTGEMYDIPNLKNCCGMLLSNMLTEKNVLMLLENAHIHKSSILQARAIAFIIAEREKIFSKSDFKEFALRLPEILFEVCSMLKFFLEFSLKVEFTP